MTTHLPVRLQSLVELEVSGIQIDEADLRLLVKHFQRNQNMTLKIQNCSAAGGESLPSRIEDFIAIFERWTVQETEETTPPRAMPKARTQVADVDD